MNYSTLYNKLNRTDPRTGEDIKDMLTLTFIVPENFEYKIFTIPAEYIARPDLISLDYYGTTDNVDIICKLNGISNPFEMNEGMMIILPSPGHIELFKYNGDTIEATANNADSQTPAPKTKSDKRTTNEAVIGDTRYKVDKERRIVIY